MATLKFRCRRQKEEYFDDPDSFAEIGPDVFSDSVSPGIPFVPVVNGRVMRDFLRKPLPNSTLSWPGAFQAQLEGVKTELARRKIPLKAVLLTGGASRMPFVEEIIRKVLADGKAVTLTYEQEPAHSVARGLALWSRQRYLIEAFRRDVKAAFESEMAGLIGARQEQLLDLLLPLLTERTLTEDAIPAILRWKAGKIETAKELRAHIKAKSGAWLRTKQGAAFLSDVNNDWWEGGLRQEFEAVVDPISKRYGLSGGAIDLTLPFHAADYYDPDISLPIPLEPLFRIVVYSVFFGAIVALPFIGPLFAATVTLIFKEVLDEVIDEQMRGVEIPVWIRKAIRETKVRSLAGPENVQKMVVDMKKRLLADDATMAKMRGQILDQLRAEVDKRTDAAARLIRFA